MYQYTLKQVVKGEEKTELVFSSQHYTEAGFKKVVKKAIKELKDDGFYLPPEKRLDMIKRELINNHEFISCTNNKIAFDVTEI
ncbi:hypothetical protein CVD28_01020 [Bacillus sp. M6-12]|uniref:hypothetical protein n=1 Tax=Bacillus sp. M6-12 TaxID=2054166 RepID=UPI000C75F68D|nr:hypothetical protein [Bacillus sp. M6-12]PLS19015.1 hypothetical protein CVD28_01020 [Bacillus sp. M6-12]